MASRDLCQWRGRLGERVTFFPPSGATLIRVLGVGSAFEVAVVAYGGRACVCKRLRARVVAEPAGKQAMEREAWALGQVQHPAVPRLIAAGHDDGGAYVLETFFDAPSLRMLSAEVRAGTRGLTSVLFRRLLYAAFGALAEIHAFEIDGQSLRLVHGDLAPDHVLIGDGRIHFIDFGQARATTWPAALAGRGTLPYVPPEVARGEQEPGQSADVFALAACFAFLALGRDPIRADLPAARLVEVGDRGLDLAQLDLAQLGKAAFGQPSLDESCIVALRRALAFHRADRIQSASDMLRGLT